MNPTEPVAGAMHEQRRRAQAERALHLWRQAEQVLGGPGHAELRGYYDRAIAIVAERLGGDATMDDLLEHYFAARRPAESWAESACRRVHAPRRLGRVAGGGRRVLAPVPRPRGRRPGLSGGR